MEKAKRDEDGVIRSRCRYCGVKMQRVEKRRWIVTGKEDRIIAQRG